MEKEKRVLESMEEYESLVNSEKDKIFGKMLEDVMSRTHERNIIERQERTEKEFRELLERRDQRENGGASVRGVRYSYQDAEERKEEERLRDLYDKLEIERLELRETAENEVRDFLSGSGDISEFLEVLGMDPKELKDIQREYTTFSRNLSKNITRALEIDELTEEIERFENLIANQEHKDPIATLTWQMRIKELSAEKRMLLGNLEATINSDRKRILQEEIKPHEEVVLIEKSAPDVDNYKKDKEKIEIEEAGAADEDKKELPEEVLNPENIEPDKKEEVLNPEDIKLDKKEEILLHKDLKAMYERLEWLERMDAVYPDMHENVKVLLEREITNMEASITSRRKKLEEEGKEVESSELYKEAARENVDKKIAEETEKLVGSDKEPEEKDIAIASKNILGKWYSALGEIDEKSNGIFKKLEELYGIEIVQDGTKGAISMQSVVSEIKEAEGRKILRGEDLKIAEDYKKANIFRKFFIKTLNGSVDIESHIAAEERLKEVTEYEEEIKRLLSPENSIVNERLSFEKGSVATYEVEERGEDRSRSELDEDFTILGPDGEPITFSVADSPNAATISTMNALEMRLAEKCKASGLDSRAEEKEEIDAATREVSRISEDSEDLSVATMDALERRLAEKYVKDSLGAESE